MTRVIIESPYAGDTDEQAETNERYARACLRDSLDRGEAPLASHLLHTQVLNDDDPEQRRKGMAAGWAWYGPGVVCAVYADLGVSGGMVRGMNRAVDVGATVEIRHVNGWKQSCEYCFGRGVTLTIHKYGAITVDKCACGGASHV